MDEYSNIIKTKELKTLEIDIDKNIFKLNGDDIKRCLKLDIEIDAHKREVCLLADTTVRFEGRKGQGGDKTMKCPNCGRENSQNANFCRGCSTKSESGEYQSDLDMLIKEFEDNQIDPDDIKEAIALIKKLRKK